MGNKTLNAMTKLSDISEKINQLVEQAASQVAEIAVEKINTSSGGNIGSLETDIGKLLYEFPDGLKETIYKNAIAYIIKSLSTTSYGESTNHSSDKKSHKKAGDRSSIFGNW